MTTATSDGSFGHAPVFPPVSARLVEGAASGAEAAEFLRAVRRWRADADTWAHAAADHQLVSRRLGDLLSWALGRREVGPPVSSAYDLFPLDDGTLDDTLDDDTRGAGAGAAARSALVWRSGVVDFLADVWDTLGPSDYDPRQCMAVIEALFTPLAVRGVLHCPDCVQPLSADEAGLHAWACPIRKARLSG